MAKPTKKTVINRLDKLARDICKKQANNTCAKCGMYSDDGTIIQWAHIEGRRKKGGLMRWSQNNCLALCAGPYSNSCHYWFDNNKIASSEWLRSAYPEKYNWLHELVNGKPRSEQLFTETVFDLLDLEQELKKTLAALNK